jgi:hypothetical protein
MCVLCKQLRRKHGSTGALPPGLVSSLAQDGRVRSGKSAFVRAVPMLLSLGPVRHAHAKLPHSRAWTPSEWAAERKGGPECGGSDDDEDEEDAGVEAAEVVTERKPIIFTTGETAPSVMDAPIVPVDTVGSPTTTEPENPLPTSNAAKRSGMSQVPTNHPAYTRPITHVNDWISTLCVRCRYLRLFLTSKRILMYLQTFLSAFH